MRLPDLRVSPSVNGTPSYNAPRIVPQQDARPDQIGAVGQGLAQAGYGITRVADFLQDQLDDAKATSLFTKYDAELDKIDQAQSARLGEDAINGYKGSMGMIEATRRQIEAGLDNEKQQELFASKANVRESHVRDRIERHTARQSLVFKSGALAASSKQMILNYQRAQDRPELAQLYKEFAISQTKKQMDMEGRSEDETKLAVLEATTEMHVGVLDSLAQDPSRAASYLSDHREEMSTAAVNRAQDQIRNDVARLRSKAVDDRSFVYADRISKMTPDLMQQRAILVGMTGEGDGQIGPEEAQHTWEKLRTLDAEKYQQQERLKKETIAGASQQFEAGGRYETLPPEVRASIESMGWTSDVKDKESSIRARKLAETKRAMDEFDIVNDFVDLPTMKKTIEALQRADFDGAEELEKQLTDVYDELTKRQAEALIPPELLTPKPAQGQALGSDAQLQEFADKIARALGYEPTPPIVPPPPQQGGK